MPTTFHRRRRRHRHPEEIVMPITKSPSRSISYYKVNKKGCFSFFGFYFIDKNENHKNFFAPGKIVKEEIKKLVC